MRETSCVGLISLGLHCLSNIPIKSLVKPNKKTLFCYFSVYYAMSSISTVYVPSECVCARSVFMDGCIAGLHVQVLSHMSLLFCFRLFRTYFTVLAVDDELPTTLQRHAHTSTTPTTLD